MSAAQSAVHLQEMLRFLPTMRLHDVDQLLASAQQCRRILQTNFGGLSSRKASHCLLECVPVAIAAHVIGSFLTDSDAVAWAKCSQQSLQQVQRRTFHGCASPDVALELANPALRHRAAFGLVDKVRISTEVDWSRIDTLPSRVYWVEFDERLFGKRFKTPSLTPMRIPKWITTVMFCRDMDEHMHLHKSCASMFRQLRLPSRLQCLHMPAVGRLHFIPYTLQHFPYDLPDSLTELSLPYRTESTNAYPRTWPPGLRILRCLKSIPLSRLPPLPLSLVELDTHYYPPIDYSQLPASLTRLDWRYAVECTPIPLDTLTLPLALEQFYFSLSDEQSLVQLLTLLPPRLRELHLYLCDSHVATLQAAITQAKDGSIRLSALRKLEMIIPTDDLRLFVREQLTSYLSSSCTFVFLP
jgi:hypothetical protein